MAFISLLNMCQLLPWLTSCDGNDEIEARIVMTTFCRRSCYFLIFLLLVFPFIFPITYANIPESLDQVRSLIRFKKYCAKLQISFEKGLRYHGKRDNRKPTSSLISLHTIFMPLPFQTKLKCLRKKHNCNFPKQLG